MKLNVVGEIGFMESFASLLNTTVENNGKIIIPEQFGKGYLQGFYFNTDLRMIIRNYELKEDMLIKKTSVPNSTERIIISFKNLFLSNKENINSDKKLLPSVQVFSGNLDSEMFFPSMTKFRTIVISIEVAYLKKLLKGDFENKILETITGKKQSFLFEELIPPSIHKIANEMAETKIPIALTTFYFKVKAEELICLLFAELLKREKTTIAALNIDDVQTIYKIRDTIIAQLNVPPNLNELAMQANFSKSKLKRLFKQIFGISFFHYYQAFRMKEAALLLKERKLSVSEVGYQMGFSNLSHFTRVFEEHIGMKPKKYSMEVNIN
ncbi:AraC-like DNA-binding protein [Tenacibaculum adriaticum]|uniref:AraC-like DNA-binding protein n=1 Tax=Tenacibaculum adriaticum TaxID=413713 RepID=A0A5S5DT58_9FLAO|nr:AraC family transcriptional regulator [Tenacibaculum adriaticum]TYP98196.1 AraC-like DNA-binding protein [Tenacibaculum adriaticum]